MWDRVEWWIYRRKLWWAYVRESGRMLTRRVEVETVLLEVSAGKREPLTGMDCYGLAMYLGSPTREFPKLESKRIKRGE